MSETFSVRELCSAVVAAVDDRFPDEVWVKGAISSLSRSNNGHVYFDLIDDGDEPGAASEAVVPVVLFSSSRTRVNHILRKSGSVRMDDGIEIRIKGRLVYYPPQGRVQLVMSLIDPAYTVGRQAVARQVLLDSLAAEGLLGANAAVAMPVVPLRIGLVTSHRSAAHADFAHELALSGYRFEVVVFDCRVQGVDAVPSLVDGIRRAGAAGVDVVAVIRGGGARTDLAAFDAEPVVRAIAKCPRPVIVGVGHEIDRSVADDVAHLSAKTPTAAAATLVESVRRFDEEVEFAAGRLVALATSRLERASAELASAGNRLTVAANGALVANHARLDAAAGGLKAHGERLAERADAAIESAALRLRALDPARLLARGWSITRTTDGALVREAAAVAVGTTLRTTLASGTLTSTVSESSPATHEPASDEDP
ncbi:MAG: exodeoxyribonuclease VII large subunit [Acidimicrobiales bacterium]